MKKVFISAALFAAVMMSCSTETTDMISDMEKECETNASFFDKSEEDLPFQREQNRDEFLKSMERLISTYREFPNFREVLPVKMLAKIDSGEYTEDEGVFVIYLWWQNDDLWDIMCEWWVWDVFTVNMPQEYFEKYGFYW